MNEDNWELGLGGTGIELEMSHGIGQNDCRAEQARNEWGQWGPRSRVVEEVRKERVQNGTFIE